MRTETTKTDIYKFSELDEDAQATAIENNYDFNVQDTYWSECIIDDAKEIAKLFGLDIDKIYLSGFSSQGDGACFEGNYQYKKGGLKAVKEYAPLDKELHSIAAGLQEVQRKNFYKLSAQCKHSGYYYHSGCMSVSVEHEDDQYRNLGDTNTAIERSLRDFADWLYSKLDEQYTYSTSAEAIQESIEANEMKFTIDGAGY